MPAFLKPLFLVASVGAIAAVSAPRSEKPADPPPAPSAAPDRSLLRAALERVVVFKDGYGLFVKSAKATADAQGRVRTHDVPDAVLGTFWASADGGEALGLLARWDEDVERRSEESSCVSVPELLRANPGRQVLLDTERGEVAGKLVRVLDGAAGAGAQDGVEREVVPRGGSLVLVEGAKGRVVLPLAEIRRVSGPELSTQCRREFERVARRKVLEVDFGRERANRPVSLRLFYFAPGIRWIPTYRLDAADAGKSRLALQAEILNEVEDIDGAAVDFVVGVPNFRFKEAPSPLSLEQVLRQALQQAAPQLMNHGFSNAMFSQRSSEYAAAPAFGASASGVRSLAGELAGESQQDLFSYPVRSMRLRKGERATVPLWRTDVAARHLYTLDLASGPGGLSAPSQPGGSPLQLDSNRIWHQLELANPSRQPWTTGPALVLRDQFPLAQELLAYAPPGGTTRLPLTVAVDLQARASEEVLERRPDALRQDGRSWTLVRKRGTLRLSSHRAEASTMQISLAVPGKVEEASDRAKTTSVDTSGRQPLGAAVVNWEFGLPAGAAKTLTWTASVYE